MRRTILSLCGGLALAAMTPPATAAETVDAKLLGMLKANGSITQAQYDELSADLAKEQKATVATESVNKKDFDDLQKKIAWAAKTVVSGDMRVRQETISIENRDPERASDRQRIRARIGIVSQVNEDVEAGVRIASGNSSDARSTNQDLDNYFVKKDLWLDRAYVNWHPSAVPGLKLIGGKMAQPWISEEQLIWDDDVNPEGLAALYSHEISAVELFGSTGAFTLKNNVNGNGNQFTDDLRLISGQLGARFALSDNLKFTVGGSLYHYHLDGAAPAGALSANGNTTTQFQLYEGFGQLDIGGLPLPLSIYGQYVKNPNANGPQSDEDMGWLAGFKTKIWEIGLNYSYRDLQRNAVVGAFTDSDFAAGFTASRGSKFQATYDIAKNFTFSTTYFMTESNAASTQAGSDVDTWQIDLLAKF
jgi:hypothetical protein